MAKEKEEKAKKVKRPTPEKRKIQDDKKRARRKAFSSQVKTAISKLKEAVKNKEEPSTIKSSLSSVYSLLDKATKKKIYKKNKGNRLKSALCSSCNKNKD
jgi:small subunit ribosomal protein S20